MISLHFVGCRRELVHPVEISTFYRSSSELQSLETIQQRVPIHFYCRTKEVRNIIHRIINSSCCFFYDFQVPTFFVLAYWQLDISLTEISLDILLFVIGELKLAGPFALKNSIVLTNCCKVCTLFWNWFICKIPPLLSFPISSYCAYVSIISLCDISLISAMVVKTYFFNLDRSGVINSDLNINLKKIILNMYV